MGVILFMLGACVGGVVGFMTAAFFSAIPKDKEEK